MWLIEFIKSNYYLKNLLPLLVFVFCFGFIYITSVIFLEKKNNNSKFVSFLNALVLTTFLYVSFIKVMGFSRFDYIFDGIKFINNYVITFHTVGSLPKIVNIRYIDLYLK